MTKKVIFGATGNFTTFPGVRWKGGGGRTKQIQITSNIHRSLPYFKILLK